MQAEGRLSVLLINSSVNFKIVIAPHLSKDTYQKQRSAYIRKHVSPPSFVGAAEAKESNFDQILYEGILVIKVK